MYPVPSFDASLCIVVRAPLNYLLTSTTLKLFEYVEILHVACIVCRVGYFDRHIYAGLEFCLPTL